MLGRRDLVTIRGTRDRRLAALAELQRGRVRRDQLRAIAITKSMIQTMLRNGRLVRRYPSVYVVGHSAPVANVVVKSGTPLCFRAENGAGPFDSVFVHGFLTTDK